MKHVIPAICVVSILLAIGWQTTSLADSRASAAASSSFKQGSSLNPTVANTPLCLSLMVPEQGPLGTKLWLIVTNTSKHPVKLWQEWCSWGYFCVTLSAEAGEGSATKLAEAIVIEKRQRPWSKNFPASFVLRPGESYRRDVELQSEHWLNGAKLLGQGPWRLTAHFEINEDDQSRSHEVWTGQLSSQPHDYHVQ